MMCLLMLQQFHMSRNAKQKSVIAVRCMCVNSFSVLMLEISNKTVQTLDSYLISLINTHTSNVYKFSGPCDQTLLFIHLAKYCGWKCICGTGKNWIYLSLSKHYWEELILNHEGIIVRCEGNSMEHNQHF